MELEGYSDIDVLSEGDVSTVYKAHQQEPDGTVAIKLLSAADSLDDSHKESFLHEAKVISRLKHPNIVRVIDYGLSNGNRPYLIMNYVQGRDLQCTLEQTTPSFMERLRMMIQLCRGIAFAHCNGVIHRALNPGNILIDNAGHVFILNFGVAWLEDCCQTGDETLTTVSAYLSPEQLESSAGVGPQSDIYSLGALLYYFFTGDPPVNAATNPRSGLTGLPKPLAEIILQCLHTQASKRPTCADDVAFQLLKLLNGALILPSDKAEAMVAIGGLAGRFELLDVISHNQYGAVYLFKEKGDDHLIVVKKRMGTHAGLRQARHLKTVSYKNIVNILGVSSKRDTFVVIMEHLVGGSLQQRLVRAWSVDDFLLVALEICYGLQKAHDEGVIHGNLRPSNILFNKQGQAKVSDFGFNKHYIGHEDRDWYQPQSRLDASIQRDIYSAGIIFHQMLTANLPRVSYGLLVAKHEFDELDGPLQTLLKGMIEMQSTNHYTSFREIINDLNNLRLGLTPPVRRVKPPEESRWKRRISLLLALASAAGAGAYLLMT